MVNRNLSKHQFKDVTFESGGDDETHWIDAYHPDFGSGQVPVGTLQWWKQDSVAGKRPVKSGEINNVSVQPNFQGIGVASHMFSMAQNFNPPARHAPSAMRTRQGKKWANKVGGDSV